MNYKVSVIMSVKDGEAYLEKSIESILNQSYKNLEFLICDDGSSDSTFEICNRYANSDKRIKIIKNNKSIGLTKSLNKLIKLTTGSIIARQDADDVSDLTRIAKQMKFYKMGKEIITSRSYIIGSKNKTKNFLFNSKK